MSTLKPYHKLLALFAIHVCVWIFLVHGWMGYATVTERGGIRYTFYLFKGITKIQFATYNFTVAFLALQFIAFQVYYLVEKKPKHLMRTFIGVLILGVLIFLIEMFFDSGFRPKG